MKSEGMISAVRYQSTHLATVSYQSTGVTCAIVLTSSAISFLSSLTMDTLFRGTPIISKTERAERKGEKKGGKRRENGRKGRDEGEKKERKWEREERKDEKKGGGKGRRAMKKIKNK